MWQPSSQPQLLHTCIRPMIGENRQLVIDEPMEFEKQPFDVQDCRKITKPFRGIYRIHPILIQENRRMSTCNQLTLQTLGSQPVMPKNRPDHCIKPTGWASNSSSHAKVQALSCYPSWPCNHAWMDGCTFWEPASKGTRWMYLHLVT